MGMLVVRALRRRSGGFRDVESATQADHDGRRHGCPDGRPSEGDEEEVDTS